MKYGHLERRIADEQQTFARPLRTLLKRGPVVCGEDVPVSRVAGLMRAEGIGSVVVLDAGGRPSGILTSHDVVAALAEGAAERAAGERMTREPLALPGHALAYEAALAMLSRRIRHVLVVEEGRLLGIVSERDLFSLQRLGLGEITMEIRLAQEVPALAGVAAEVRKLTARLVEHGVAAEQLMALVSVLNDRITQRAIELVRKRHDLERISWCWLAFGSEGRLEQTFSSDQDNGLLFAAHDGSAPAAARVRLLPFAREVNEALAACGFPLCRGNVMASNAELCLSADEWRAKMAGWIESSVPKALLEAAIVFDFRAIYGDASLADALRRVVHDLARRHPVFLRNMAENALQAQPALGAVGGFATSDEGTIDLKLQGARIFTDAARIFALAHAIRQTNTAERLRAAQSAMGLQEADAAVAAFFTVQSLRLRLENRIDPSRLGRLEAAALKESLRVARELQDRLRLDYGL